MLQEENLGSLFTSTIMWEVSGDIAFHRMTDKGVEKDINAGLYDSIMLTFAELCIDTHKEAKQRKQVSETLELGSTWVRFMWEQAYAMQADGQNTSRHSCGASSQQAV